MKMCFVKTIGSGSSDREVSHKEVIGCFFGRFQMPYFDPESLSVLFLSEMVKLERIQSDLDYVYLHLGTSG